jgi:hypothetical protein
MNQEVGFESLRKRIGSTSLKVESQSQSRLTGRLEFQSNRSLYQNKNGNCDDDEYEVLTDGCEAHWEVVKRILFVFSKLNSGQSYVQGMNEIIGPIYYTFATDPNVEWKGKINIRGIRIIKSNIVCTRTRSIELSDTRIHSVLKFYTRTRTRTHSVSKFYTRTRTRTRSVSKFHTRTRTRTRSVSKFYTRTRSVSNFYIRTHPDATVSATS